MAGVVPRVTAVILTCNDTDETIACVESLRRATYPKLDVIVVDNGSTDGAMVRIPEALPGIHLRFTGANLGYTGGINSGIRWAQESKPDYILVLNPDTVVEPDFLDHLVQGMEAHPKAAVACGTIYAFHQPSLVWYAGGRMLPWRGLAIQERKGEFLPPDRLGEPRTVSFITGCLALYRTSALEVVGLQDERFFLYLDDIETSARIVRKGFELLYVPRAVIHHHVEGEAENPFKVYYSVRNRYLLIHTAYTGATRLGAALYFTAVITAKIVVWSITNRLFLRAALMGLGDYALGRLGAGRGLQVFGRKGWHTSDLSTTSSKIPPAVHAVLLNWNSYECTSACIASLRRSGLPFARIIVVDNGSHDGSIERLEAEWSDPQMLFIRNATNRGFSGGMNVGFRAALEAGAEMIFSINNDTEVDPTCLDRLVRTVQANPRCGVAGPTIYFHSRPEIIWQAGGSFLPLRAGIKVPLKGKDASAIPPEPIEVTFLSGCAILIRSSVLKAVGMLDEGYFFYGEDLDYGLRVAQSGYAMVYVPEASVWHKIEDVATDRTSPYVLYHLARSTTLFYRKRFTPPYRWYAFGVQIGLYTPFRLWQIVKGGAGVPSLVAWLRGLVDGMRGASTGPLAQP